MAITVAKVVEIIETLYSPYLAIPGDKIGLQLGNPDQPVDRILISLEITPTVVEEAIKTKSNLIIAHHPLIYTPLLSLVTSSPLAKMIANLIEHHIAVYIAHTNLDFAPDGTTRHIANLIGLQNQKNIIPFTETKLKKLVVFIPATHIEKVAQSIFDAGAGVIGNYSECSFRTLGIGSFRAGNKAKPFLGKIEKLESVEEIRFETIVPEAKLTGIISAMLQSHPYEEVAYDIYPLDNPYPQSIVCISGKLTRPMKLAGFAKLVKQKLKLETIRIVGNRNRIIRTAAVIAGSGMSVLASVIKSGVDVFLTGDIKHHQAREAELAELVLLDIGHYSSEIIYLPILKQKLAAVLPATISLYFAKKDSNPIQTC
ncbi:MAG: Nif3-like dinuclear metal center hexameric protein [bacterium]